MHTVLNTIWYTTLYTTVYTLLNTVPYTIFYTDTKSGIDKYIVYLTEYSNEIYLDTIMYRESSLVYSEVHSTMYSIVYCTVFSTMYIRQRLVLLIEEARYASHFNFCVQ